MRILVVEDEARLATALQRGLQAEVGPGHHGAREPVDMGGLKIDEKVGGAPGRERPVGRGGDRADGQAATEDGDGRTHRDQPTQTGTGREDRHWDTSCRP